VILGAVYRYLSMLMSGFCQELSLPVPMPDISGSQAIFPDPRDFGKTMGSKPESGPRNHLKEKLDKSPLLAYSGKVLSFPSMAL
jgi:hypothetical protein